MFDTLNRDQRKAVVSITEIFRLGEKSIVGLQGAGGTGKTYTAKYLIESLGGKTIGLTPTNEARRLLSESLGIACRTLSSFLKKLPEYDDQGILEFNFGMLDNNPLDEYAICIVDESSMVNAQDASLLADLFNSSECKLLILLYDKYQHFPVLEKESTLLTQVRHEFELLIQERQKDGSPIVPVIKEARESVETDRESYDPRFSFRKTNLVSGASYISGKTDILGESGFIYAKRELCIAEIAKLFNSAYSTGNFTSVKAIAYRNATIEKLNASIREKLVDMWKDNPDLKVNEDADFFQGELLVCKKPVTVEEFSERHGKFFSLTKIDTTAACLITRISDKVSEQFELNIFNSKTGKITGKKLKFEYYECLVASIKTKIPVIVQLPTLDSKKLWEKSIEEKRKSCVVEAATTGNKKCWGEYMKLLKLFHDFDHGYAINSHQSQGNSYDVIYVDANDIATIPDRDAVNRGFYVALSRARKTIMISKD